jgi:hypothetical protein
MPFVTLSKAFVEQISACGEVLVVASPFYDPLVVKRGWCLYEAVMAYIHGVPTTVVSPPSAETSCATGSTVRTGTTFSSRS